MIVVVMLGIWRERRKVLQCGGAAAVCTGIMRQSSSSEVEEMFLFHAPYPCW